MKFMIIDKDSKYYDEVSSHHNYSDKYSACIINDLICVSSPVSSDKEHLSWISGVKQGVELNEGFISRLYGEIYND